MNNNPYNQNQKLDKKSFYVNFGTEMFLGAKELLKSMPAFYNKIYFSSKYATALWSGDREENFSNVTLLTDDANITLIRQIIKNNFLYIGEWDSKKFTDKADYGFSFIGGNIKYIVMPFKELPEGYLIRNYDVDTGDCFETTLKTNKQFFLDTSIKENGEIVRTADFNLEDMTAENTVKERAPRKAGPELVRYDANRGSTLPSMILGLLVATMSITAVYASYSWITNILK